MIIKGLFGRYIDGTLLSNLWSLVENGFGVRSNFGWVPRFGSEVIGYVGVVI